MSARVWCGDHLDRNVVSRCGAVRILVAKWAGVVARWPFRIVTWSPVVVRRCDAVAISDRNVVSRCCAVRILGAKWAGVVAR